MQFGPDVTKRFCENNGLDAIIRSHEVLAVQKIVYDEATMVEMEIPDDAQLTVCGDTHGRSPLVNSDKKY
jgi:serine/threonine-protein phosphatase 5